MNASDDGYGVTTGYTYGYYRRLSPSWLRLMATIHSVPFPEGEPFRYFELGYGQGVSLNVHAATNPGEYWGTDYNPEHVEFARQMAQASGAPVHLLDLSFEELAERDDLPQFQVIVAHGIWSWISDSSRAAVLRFVDKHLVPGGLLYLSYNALPGAASGIAVQRLIRTLTQSMDPALSERERFEQACEHLRTIEGAANSHFANYSKARERLDRILNAKSTYVLHEYTVDAWEPMLLTDVAAALRPIGLEFIGTAELDSRMAWQVTDNGHSDDLGPASNQTTLGSVMLREALRDFEFDRQFRNDLFVRGSARAGPEASKRLLMEQSFALTRHPDAVGIVADDASDETDAALCRAVLSEFLNRPDGIAAVDTISDSLHGATPSRILRSILLSAGVGALHPVGEDIDEAEIKRARALNGFLMMDQPANSKINIAASPLVGAGVRCFGPAPISGVTLANDPDHLDQLSKNSIEGRQCREGVNFTALALLKMSAIYSAQRAILENLKIETKI